MPQTSRKKPFSGKQKKQLLKSKRERKRHKSYTSDSDDEVDQNQGGDEPCVVRTGEILNSQAIMKMNYQRKSNPSSNANRYALHFYRETDKELEERKKLAKEPIVMVQPGELEIQEQDIFLSGDLAFPKRPVKDFNLTGEELDKIEYGYFQSYLEKLEAEFGALNKISYFEMNLETWRQLWRVIEMSDVILAIADVKHPVYHFPPALYHYVVDELGKEMILILNKVDLVEAPLVLAWLSYWRKKFPKLHVIPFASYAGMKVKEKGKHKGRRFGKFKMAAEGSRRLLKVLQKIVGDKVDLTSWNHKIDEELREERRTSDTSDDEGEEEEELNAQENVTNITVDHSDYRYHEWKQYDAGILTIGFVGHPNVGKSSLMNAIMGKKVVSVSRTPGHTKHFQTIFLTDNVKLCDCPGLVLPSRAPKQMQVLMGCFPISQLREPYSAVAFLAQRVNVPKILRLKHVDPDEGSPPNQWSAFEICEAWAVARGYLTAKTGRPDVYRAANHLLRLALDGRTLCLTFYPPNYWKGRDTIWTKDPELSRIKYIQCETRGDVNQKGSEGGDEKDTSDEDSSEEESAEDAKNAQIKASSNRFAVLASDD